MWMDTENLTSDAFSGSSSSPKRYTRVRKGFGTKFDTITPVVKQI